MHVYLKALHIIFVVTWFSGLFYVVRLFIYNTEAGEKPEPEKRILREQFAIMIKRLWLGIAWPSAIITLILGLWLLHSLGTLTLWLWIKIGFVIGLYAYHFSLHALFDEQRRGIFRFTSSQLRIWNEVATVFLVAVVMLAVVKNSMSWAWGLSGLVVLLILLMSGIEVYRILRMK